MRFIQILLCIIAIPFLIISLYQFINRYAEWQEYRAIEQHHLDKVGKLKKERDSLKKYIDNLKSDEFAQERLVRRYGYIKHGETVYQIVTNKEREDKEDTETFLGGFIVR